MKFNKILAFLLVFCMTMVGMPHNATTTSAAVVDANSQYRIGNIVQGFQILSNEYSKEYQSDVYEFEHLKTGAHVIWFKNSDTNRTFSIGFNTPAENDKGINHILEHSVISGSEKYSATDLMFDIMNNTYVSFINAFTSQNMTVYPVSSLSEKQLLKSADAYLDGVFHPSALKDQRYFQREAWRYELSDVNADLQVAGTVYNEMKGYDGNMNNAARYNSNAAIFDTTNQANVSGGVPGDILTLTYEEFCNTYNKYYHPSNCLVTLYGDLDCSKFLQLLNEDYFSEYSKKEVNFERVTVPEYDGIKKSVYEFPVSKDTKVSRSSIIEYCFTLDDMRNFPVNDLLALSLIANLMNLDSSTLQLALSESKIADSYTIQCDSLTYQPVIRVVAQNADESRADEFAEIVDSAIDETIKNGFDSEFIKSWISSLKIGEVISAGSNTGINTSLNAQLYYNMYEDATINVNEFYYELEDQLDEHILEELLRKYVVNNKRKSLTITKQSRGLAEINNKEFEKKLETMKSTMSTEALEALVESTKAFQAFNTQTTSPEVIESLKGITVDELPVEVPSYHINDTTMDGARLLSTKAEIDDVNITTAYFDASHLNEEELLYLQFYSQMISLGSPTKNRSEAEVLSGMVSDAYNLSMSVVPMSFDEDSIVPAFQTFFYSSDDTYKDGLDFVSDVLLNTELENSNTYIERTIAQAKATYNYYLTDTYNLAVYAALASVSEAYQYYSYLYGLDYYDFILELEKEFSQNPKDVIDKMIAVRDKAFSRNDLTVIFAGDEQSLKTFNSDMDAFISQLPDIDTKPYKLKLPVYEEKEGWIANVGASHVFFAADVNQFESNSWINLVPIMKMLEANYLTPMIRYNGAAYSTVAQVDSDSMICGSYFDGNIALTMDAIYGIPSFMDSIKNQITDQDIESYILSSYSTYALQNGPLLSAYQAITNYCVGYTVEEQIDVLTRLKSVSVSDIETYTSMFKQMIDEGNYVIVGPRSAIEENKDLFDKIVDLTKEY